MCTITSCCRGYEIYAQDEDGAFLYDFKKTNYSVEQYKVFMRRLIV